MVRSGGESGVTAKSGVRVLEDLAGEAVRVEDPLEGAVAQSGELVLVREEVGVDV